MPSLGDAILFFKADKSDLDKGFKEAERDGESFSSRLGNTIGTGVKAAFAVGAIGVTAAIGGIFKGIASNADFEAYQAQFESLYGTLDGIADPVASAKEHIQSLSAFAASTPFDLPSIIKASKTMLTFGGAALDTEANLKMVGNAAAAAGAPIDQVSTYVGKAYAAIQNGQPFGEAAAELQNMGVLSGEARRQLEQMQKEGKSGPEVWAAFQAGLTAPTDAMDKLGKTWGGLMSTMGDTVDGAMRSATKPLFEILKPALESTLGWLNTPEVQGAIIAFGTKLGNGIMTVIGFFQTAMPMIQNGLATVIGAINSVLAPALTLGQYLAAVADDGDTLNDFLMNLPGWMQPVAQLFGNAVIWIQGFTNALLGAFTNGGVQGGISGLLGEIGKVSPMFQLIRAVFDAAFVPIQSIITTMFTIVRDFIATNGAEIMTTISGVWTQVQTIINTIIPPIQEVVSTIFGAIATFLTAHSTEIGALFKTVWDTISLVITSTLTFIQDFIVPVLSAIAGFISAHATEIQTILSGVWEVIKGVVNGAMTIIQGIIQTVTALISGDWSGAWDGIKTILSGVWTAIEGVVTGTLTIIQTAISTAWDAVELVFSGAWDGIKTAFLTTWDDLKAGVDAVLGPIQDAITTAWNAVATVTTNIFSGMRDTVDNVWNGILNGLKAPINAVIDVVNTLIEGANAVGDVFGAGNIGIIPRLAKGSANFGGGLFEGGELRPEGFRTPSGQMGVLTGGMYVAPRGTEIIPSLGGGSGGKGVTLNQSFVINGNPDQSMIDQLGRIARESTESALAEYIQRADMQRSQ